MSALSEPFDMALPTFLRHIEVLEAYGLIGTRKKGRIRTCFLEPSALFTVENWLSDRRALWNGRLDRLGIYLDESKATRRRKR